MFKLSAEIEYAYVALVKLASNHSQPGSTKLADIVAGRGLSEKFMLQVLTDLRRAGLVQSRRGKRGGYALSRDPSQITLGDLFQLAGGQGEGDSNRFAIASPQSFLAGKWREIVAGAMADAAKTTLAEALEAERREDALMYHI